MLHGIGHITVKIDIFRIDEQGPAIRTDVKVTG